ncbi:MAG: ABC transporter ATP-binding protein [Deltaproteobacteria bacterium]|nr:ABC transporter ATP-binding protein [Deltaproteobacteria bacterium]
MNPILELRGVGKDYGDFRVEDVSFQLPVGHVMGLIGPNGAGKTTLIKSIMGLLSPTSGEVRLFGRAMADDEVAIRSRIGFVYDDARHYPHLSLRKLRSVVAPFYERWDEAFFQDLVRRFELPLDKQLKKFSQGMVTKAALALALSHHAELIVMDEPTSGLDPAFRRELLEIVADLLKDGKKSVLFSTHITSDLERIADYITFVKGGRLVFSENRDELFDRFAIVRGARELLDDATRAGLLGVREHSFGFEGLTGDASGMQSLLGQQAVIERASLEDILYLTGKREA